MSRRLAEDRCQRRRHLLAWVEVRGEARLAVWRSADAYPHEGRVYRDKKAVTVQALPVEEVLATPILHAFATCPCGTDHSVDLADLARRARDGETAPVLHRRILH